MRHSIRRLGCGILVLAGCHGASNDIRGRDDAALLPTFRVRVPIHEPVRVDADGDGVARRVNGIFDLELGLSYADGDFNQDGNGINTDYTMFEPYVGVRGGFEVRETLRLEGIGGLGYHRLDLDFTNFSGRVNRDEDGIGPLLGVQVSWEPVRRLTFYGRATALLMPPASTSAMAEVGLSFRVMESMSVVAGYRHWRYRFEESGTGDIDLKVDGLLLGVVLGF